MTSWEDNSETEDVPENNEEENDASTADIGVEKTVRIEAVENIVEDENEEKDEYQITDTSEENDDMPDEYLFPSHMAFVLWGPYAEPHKRK